MPYPRTSEQQAAIDDIIIRERENGLTYGEIEQLTTPPLSDSAIIERAKFLMRRKRMPRPVRKHMWTERSLNRQREKNAARRRDREQNPSGK